MIDRKLTKQDLEGFLSAFKFNTHGATDIKKVAPLVFEKDSNKLSLAIASKVRTNPPPPFVNQDLVADGDIADEATARRLRGILVQIEDVLTGGKVKNFENFRKFDMDGDGFVSYKDF